MYSMSIDFSMISSTSWRDVSDHQTLHVCSEIVWGPFEHPCRIACRLAKRYVCAFKSFPAVATTALSSLRTILGEHCLIAKRFVCAAKSFRGLLAPIEAQGADSPNATCVRSNRFRQSVAVATRILGPFNDHQTLRT